MRDLIRNILENEVMTSQQAADMLEVDSSEIRLKAAKGTVPCVLKGATNLFDIQDIKLLIK